MLKYPAKLTKDGCTTLVTFRDIPEAITFGRNEKEALEKAVEALETAESFYFNANKVLPKSSTPAPNEKVISIKTI